MSLIPGQKGDKKSDDTLMDLLGKMSEAYMNSKKENGELSAKLQTVEAENVELTKKVAKLTKKLEKLKRKDGSGDESQAEKLIEPLPLPVPPISNKRHHQIGPCPHQGRGGGEKGRRRIQAGKRSRRQKVSRKKGKKTVSLSLLRSTEIAITIVRSKPKTRSPIRSTRPVQRPRSRKVT